MSTVPIPALRVGVFAMVAWLGPAGCVKGTRSTSEECPRPAPPLPALRDPTPVKRPLGMIDEDVPADCGEAIFQQAELTALGYGKQHPTMRGLDAKLETCPRDAKVPDVLCSEALLHQQDLELTGLGPKHPAMLASRAMLAVCARPIRVTKAQCRAFQKEGDDLRYDGRGASHPEVRAAEKRFAACEAARRESPPVVGTARLVLRGGSGDFTAVDEPLALLQVRLASCAPIDAEQRFVDEVLELTIVMDRKHVTDARATGAKSSPATIACVTQLAKSADLRGSPGTKLSLGVELIHGYYE